jgi:methyl-accepting chemotaxis protein
MGAAALAAVKKVAESSDKIAKTSRRIGVSSAFLQEMGHAAELSGASMNDVTVGVRRLAAAAYDASRGSKETKQAFQALGVSVKDAGGRLKSTEQLTLEAFHGLANLKDETLRTALAQRLFGRSGTALLPMLSGGVEGLVEMANEAQRLGIVLDDEALKGAEDFNDAMLRMRGTIAGVIRRVASGLMPLMTEWVKKIQAWVTANQDLIKQRLEQGLEALGSVLRSMSDVLRWVVKHWQTIKLVLLTLVAGRILAGIVGITNQVASMAGALAQVTAGAGGVSGAVGKASGAVGKLAGALGAAGQIGMALGVGWTIGTLLDRWVDASGWLAKNLHEAKAAFEAPQRAARRRAVGIRAGGLELGATARRLAELRERGVGAVTTRAGERFALDQAGISRLLQQQASNVGLSGDLVQRMLPGLLRMAQAAPAPQQSSRNFQMGAPQITVNVPPGTSATQAQRVAEAAGAATTRSMRRAMGDVAR